MSRIPISLVVGIAAWGASIAAAWVQHPHAAHAASSVDRDGVIENPTVRGPGPPFVPKPESEGGPRANGDPHRLEEIPGLRERVPLRQTPDQNAASDWRERRERAMMLDLKEWDRRIAAMKTIEDGAHASDVKRLREAWRLAKQQWEKLRQSTEDRWLHSEDQYQRAYDRLEEAWAEVAGG